MVYVFSSKQLRIQFTYLLFLVWRSHGLWDGVAQQHGEVINPPLLYPSITGRETQTPPVDPNYYYPGRDRNVFQKHCSGWMSKLKCHPSVFVLFVRLKPKQWKAHTRMASHLSVLPNFVWVLSDSYWMMCGFTVIYRYWAQYLVHLR